jgi:hypothetical protein
MRLPAKIFALATVVLAGGCTSRAEPPGCGGDGDCRAGQGCYLGGCLPKLAASQTWSVDVLPSGEAPWARTETPFFAFSSMAPVPAVVLDTHVTIQGSFEREDEMGDVATARVLLALPSRIPGAGDRLFETQATSQQPRGPLVFRVRVPQSTLGGPATLSVLPGPPIDRALPPWTTLISRLTSSITVAVPRTPDLWLIEGMLLDEFEVPVSGYLARATLAGRLVSNVVPTDEQGRFRLLIPRYAPNGGPLSMVSLEVSPADSLALRPHLIVPALSETKLNLGTLKLPPFPNPQKYMIPITGGGMGIPGVTLRFVAFVPGATGGEGWFRRETQTDLAGIANVQLLPGNPGEIREYSIALIPGPNSTYAGRCVPAYAVAMTPGGEGRVGAAIELSPKVEVSGQILDNAGLPIPGVTITAERLNVAAYDPQCRTDVASPASIVTSEVNGSFRFFVAPGRYRVEYQTPPTRPAPLFTEPDLVVSGTLKRQVKMPAGVLADGVVQSPDGKPVAGCEVRVLGRGIGAQPSAPAEVRAQGRTGSDGRFRVILPWMP